MGSQTLPPSSQEITTHVYRPVKPLPFELREHCTVYFQEELHSQALTLLINLLISGADAPAETSRAVCLPPAQILALAATLIVHPALTTRLPKDEKITVADEALFYLDHVNSLVGATNAGLGEAFQFTAQSLSRSTKRRDRSVHSPGDGEVDGNVSIKLTNEEALWNRADDFWSVVGWAFNCSVKHPRRWARWRLWLELMIDVLHDDLMERASSQTCQPVKLEKTSGSLPNGSSILLKDALLTQFLDATGDSRSEKRRVMRACLADGDKKTLNEFGEIWKSETKERKEKDESLMVRKKLDFEKDEFADYMDVDDEDEEDANEIPGQSRSSTQPRSRGSRSIKQETTDSEDSDASAEDAVANTIDDFGGMSSITLRQRLLALLVTYSGIYPRGFMDAEDIFDLYTEFLRPLPLAFFTQFVMPSSPWLEPHAQASLNQMLLRPLISSEAPTYNENNLTQEDLERHFLPFAANQSNVVNNAKVSILVESLTRLLWRHGELRYSASLKNAVEQGIKARDTKSGFDGRRKNGGAKAQDEEARRMLSESSMRMQALLKFIEAG